MRHLACASDRNYLPHIATMLHSALLHRGDEDVHVHYVHGPDLPPADAALLEGMVRGLGAEITLHLVEDERLEGLLSNDNLPASTWYRAFVAEALEGVERALYIDGDAVVVDSLEPLWRTELGDHYLAAVTNVLEPWNAGYPAGALGLPGPEAYFNGGVLLMNLGLMRAEGAADAVLDYGRAATPENALFVDQCALNVVLSERRLPLHPRWNVMNSVMLFPHSVELFGERAVAEARERPGIRHFEGPSVNKPWHYLCEHGLRELYDRHRRQTPWPTYRPEGAGPRNMARRAARHARRRFSRLSS
jgi:lipopolysaccharide biosynthesis glycosyltransferase